jgi:hypothetical protein
MVAAVSPLALTGHNGMPMISLTKVDFPRLTSPKIATLGPEIDRDTNA